MELFVSSEAWWFRLLRSVREELVDVNTTDRQIPSLVSGKLNAAECLVKVSEPIDFGSFGRDPPDEREL